MLYHAREKQHPVGMVLKVDFDEHFVSLMLDLKRPDHEHWEPTEEPE